MKKTNTVLVSGCFNIIHPGHLRLLRAAKNYGANLVVAVESDRIAGFAAHIRESSRLEGVQNLSLVNEAFIFDEPISQVIARIKPEVVVKGKEHETKYNPEFDAINQYGGSLVFSSGEAIFSSLDLIRKEFQETDLRTIELPVDFLRHHGLINSKLGQLIKNFLGLRVCVIGDLIVDEYITCEPLGMSQEDPTIVVTPIDSKRFIGGAGIVAAHACSLGAKVDFISVAGNDEVGVYALEYLSGLGINCKVCIDKSRPTTLKQRYRSKGKSLLRVSHLHQEPISMSLQSEIYQAMCEVLAGVDVLVFSDFNYGCLPQSLVDNLIQIAKKNNILIAADSQSSSQVGDISRFKNMDLITPTEREARISTRNHEDGLVVMTEQLKIQASAKNIILKLGEEGLLVHAENGKGKDWLTDRIHALNRNPKDVAGAGDSLLIAAAMTLACGGSIWEAATIGSLAAAIQVGRLGNTPINADELLGELL